MDLTIPGPLGELGDPELYQLLGEAWYARFRPVEGEDDFLAPSAEIGKREYEALRSQLQVDMHPPVRDGVVACVSTTIRRVGVWRMPATVIAVLAIRHGLERVERSSQAN